MSRGRFRLKISRLGIGKDLMALEAFIRAQEVWDIGFTGLKVGGGV